MILFSVLFAPIILFYIFVWYFIPKDKHDRYNK